MAAQVVKASAGERFVTSWLHIAAALELGVGYLYSFDQLLLLCGCSCFRRSDWALGMTGDWIAAMRLERDSSRDAELHFSSRARSAKHFKFRPDAFRPFAHPGQAPVSV